MSPHKSSATNGFGSSANPINVEFWSRLESPTEGDHDLPEIQSKVKVKTEFKLPTFEKPAPFKHSKGSTNTRYKASVNKVFGRSGIAPKAKSKGGSNLSMSPAHMEVVFAVANHNRDVSILLSAPVKTNKHSDISKVPFHKIAGITGKDVAYTKMLFYEAMGNYNRETLSRTPVAATYPTNTGYMSDWEMED